MRSFVVGAVLVLGCGSPDPIQGGGGQGGDGSGATAQGGSGQGGSGQGGQAQGGQAQGGAQSTGGGTTTSGGGGAGGGPVDCAVAPNQTACETGTCCDGVCRSDYSSDAMNCGSCGNDCGGGSCVDGVCQGVVIATTTYEFLSLDQDAGHVYVSDYGNGLQDTAKTIRIDKATLAQDFIISTGWGNASLGVIGNELFQAMFHLDGVGAVYRGTLANFTGTYSPVYTSGAAATYPGQAYSHLAHTSSQVAFATKNEVFVANVSNSANQSLEGSSDWAYSDIVLDTSRVYWLDQTNGKIRARANQPVPNNAANFDLVTGQVGAKGLALSATEVFWSITDMNQNANIGIFSAPKANSLQVATTVLGGVDAQKLAVDGPEIFWTTGLSGKAERCQIANCAQSRVTYGNHTGRGNDIIVDAEYIFYIGDDGKTLYRAKR